MASKHQQHQAHAAHQTHANRAQPKLDMEKLAAQYGWAYSLLKSDKELAAKFSQAVSETWPAQKFAAELMKTNWYRKHGQTWRQNEALKATDPGQWRNRYNEAFQHVQTLAHAMGSSPSAHEANVITHTVMSLGYSDEQINQALSHYVRLQSSGDFTGHAGGVSDTLKKYANSNGVGLSQRTMNNYVRSIEAGTYSIETAQDFIRKQAIAAFPTFEKQISAGVDVADLASPYMQSMGNILEVNPGELDLFNPTIRKALQATDDKGQPTSKPLWQFENELRKDPRWLKTKNAQDSLLSAGHQVLSDFGLGF